MIHHSQIAVLSLAAWWRHQMETFSALLAICAGNSPVPGEFPTQRPVSRSFDVFFGLCLNKRLSKQPWGWWFETQSWSLWRYCNGWHLRCSPELSARGDVHSSLLLSYTFEIMNSVDFRIMILVQLNWYSSFSCIFGVLMRQSSSLVTGYSTARVWWL